MSKNPAKARAKLLARQRAALERLDREAMEALNAAEDAVIEAEDRIARRNAARAGVR